LPARLLWTHVIVTVDDCLRVLAAAMRAWLFRRKTNAAQSAAASAKHARRLVALSQVARQLAGRLQQERASAALVLTKSAGDAAVRCPMSRATGWESSARKAPCGPS
jgi:hypothetical protein